MYSFVGCHTPERRRLCEASGEAIANPAEPQRNGCRVVRPSPQRDEKLEHVGFDREPCKAVVLEHLEIRTPANRGKLRRQYLERNVGNECAILRPSQELGSELHGQNPHLAITMLLAVRLASRMEQHARAPDLLIAR